MGSGENEQIDSSNINNIENDENVTDCFDDARELPNSEIPPSNHSSFFFQSVTNNHFIPQKIKK